MRFGGIQRIGRQGLDFFVDLVERRGGRQFAKHDITVLAVDLDQSQVGQGVERIQAQAGVVEGGAVVDVLGMGQQRGHENLRAGSGNLDLHVAVVGQGEIDGRLHAVDQFDMDWLATVALGQQAVQFDGGVLRHTMSCPLVMPWWWCSECPAATGHTTDCP